MDERKLSKSAVAWNGGYIVISDVYNRGYDTLATVTYTNTYSRLVGFWVAELVPLEG